MSRLWTTLASLCLVLATSALPAPAQSQQPANEPATFNVLLNLDGTNGAYPNMSFIQGLDGDLYGTARAPTFLEGSIFKITPAGALTQVYDFCETNCNDGELPNGLVLATDGNFYGTTYYGGTGTTCYTTEGCGAFFKMTPDGTLTTLYSFCSLANCADGANPYTALTQATDGNFYGTAQNGGANFDGTVFKLTPQGGFTLLHTFDGTDGAFPTSTLAQSADGKLYGSAFAGGEYGWGTVFKIAPEGMFSVLHSFNGTDGGVPLGALVEAGGRFFGTTSSGGTGIACPLPANCGTFFTITPSGELTTLYSFCSRPNCSDGNIPSSPIIQGTDGYFYGTTLDFETSGNGTIFKVSPDGALTTLHTFDGDDGSFPNGLFQATDGTFYGTAGNGGSDGYGTIFTLSVGLNPFVETVPTVGWWGGPVKILGSDLSGATQVLFNKSEAAFKVVSNTEIQTWVPLGALGGTVTVTIPGQVLKSNVPFQVRP